MSIKEMFSSPKRVIITALSGLLLAGGLGFAGAYTAKAVAQDGAIGAENAEYFAFADAGVDPAKAVVSHTEFEYEQGQFVYEIEFFSNGTEYEYWIKASDGSIVKKKIEIKNIDGAVTTALAEITLDEAKATALKDAGVSAGEVTFTKEKLDVEDGITVYEIEFFTKNGEYEYELNAATGKIHSKSSELYIRVPEVIAPVTKDEAATTTENAPKPETAQSNGQVASAQNGEKSAEQSQPSQQTAPQEQQNQNNDKPAQGQGGSTGGSIDVDKAKKIALDDAGVSASEAKFTEAKLDREDGIKVYDIEFFTEYGEYEYEINAKTGAIVSRSNEYHRSYTQEQGSSQNHPQPTQKPQHQQGEQSTNLSAGQAKSIALADAGLSADSVTFKKTKLDREDGIMVYEIEFLHGGMEYEYEIDASSGAILECDVDYDD